ncbi:hypothetical protein [Planctomycetes bacterium K23_9]|uniref:Uncharacterized protein n=1 Tax=Stieleria marina TaxID=1930275 RepID=A0A517NW11_9BACT|nr:hypothetical protein K239x_33170 [Planctomycetes bacterium K23_9]
MTHQRRSGSITLDGEFRIEAVHNHYPSGGPCQTFGAVIWIQGSSVDKNECKVQHDDLAKSMTNADGSLAALGFDNLTTGCNATIKNALIKFVDQTIVGVPTIRQYHGEDTLEVPQPIAAFAFWQFVLTQTPAGTYYIAYGINEPAGGSDKASWAFLQPTPKSFIAIGSGTAANPTSPSPHKSNA